MRALLIAFRVLLAALILKRLIIDLGGVRRRLLPWTRAIVPVILLVAGALVATGRMNKPTAATAAMLLDAAIVVLCITVIRSATTRGSQPLEAAIAASLDRFFPAWFGRLAGMDIAMLMHARRGAREIVAPSPPTPLSYTGGSKIGIAAVIVGIGCIPDAIFLWLLIPHAYWYVALALDVLDVWACVWLLGALGTMAACPHRVEGSRWTFYNGIFHRIELDASHLLACERLSAQRIRRIPNSLRKKAAVLAIGGSSLVHLQLDRDVAMHSAFRTHPKHVRDVIVASDDPDGLIRLLAPSPS